MNLELRHVKEEDCDLLFKWINDETVRQNAFNSHVITYQEHVQWFRSKLESDSSTIYIYCLDGEPIGQIRVDFDNNVGIISYSIAREHRGKGLGSELLRDIKKKAKDLKPEIVKLAGRVKHNNIASCKAFEKAGYKRNDCGHYIEYYIKY